METHIVHDSIIISKIREWELPDLLLENYQNCKMTINATIKWQLEENDESTQFKEHVRFRFYCEYLERCHVGSEIRFLLDVLNLEKDISMAKSIAMLLITKALKQEIGNIDLLDGTYATNLFTDSDKDMYSVVVKIGQMDYDEEYILEVFRRRNPRTQRYILSHCKLDKPTACHCLRFSANKKIRNMLEQYIKGTSGN